jgi:hypothetical protein
MAILSETPCVGIQDGLSAHDFSKEVEYGQTFYFNSSIYLKFMSLPGANFRAVGYEAQPRVFMASEESSIVRAWEIPELDNWLFSNMLYERETMTFGTEISERTCTIILDDGGEDETIIVGRASLGADPVEALGDAMIQIFALSNFDDLRRV